MRRDGHRRRREQKGRERKKGRKWNGMERNGRKVREIRRTHPENGGEEKRKKGMMRKGKRTVESKEKEKKRDRHKN